MCFSSLQEWQLHNEKFKKARSKIYIGVSDVWRWASFSINLENLNFVAWFTFPLFLFSHPLCSIFFWFYCSHFCWGYMSHLLPLRVTVMKPSSHWVHPKFPFQDASYSKPYLVKNKPLKKFDERQKKSGDPGEGTGMRWTHVEKL